MQLRDASSRMLRVTGPRSRVRQGLSAHRDTIAGGLTLLALVLMLLSAYNFRPQPQSLGHYRPSPPPSVYYAPAAPWLLAGGSLALLGALVLSRRVIVPPRPSPAALAPAVLTRWHWLAVVGGGLALSLLAEANGRLLGIHGLAGMSPPVQMVLLVAGGALVTVGLGGVTPARAAAWWTGPGTRREIGIVALITLLALGLRFWHLGSSIRVLVDETHFIIGVRSFWPGSPVRLMAPLPTGASAPYLFSYWQSWMVDLLGRNFLGLRALSAILGTLTIPALYLLARSLFDRSTAMIAALVLATFPPHLHFSRLGLIEIAGALFGTLALAFLARALRSSRRIDYALVGVMLGGTQYFHEGARLLFPALVLAWMIAGLVLWRPRPSWRGLVVTGLAFAIIAAPVYYTLGGVGFPLLNRMDNAGMDASYWASGRELRTIGTYLAHFRQSIMFYINAPENTTVFYYLFYGGSHPLILEPVVPAFLLGIVIVLWRWRSTAILLAGWVLATSIGNTLLIESAVAPRYVLVFPALALLIAVGVRGTLPLIWPGRGLRVVTGLLVIVLAVGQAAYYFGPHLDRFNVEVREPVERDSEDALLRAAAFPSGTQVYLVGDRLIPETDARQLLEFLADGLELHIVSPRDVTTLYLLGLPADRDLAFFVAPDDAAIWLRLRQVFGVTAIERSPYDVPPDKEFYLYYVPAVWP